jgi:hypothetical protein
LRLLGAKQHAGAQRLGCLGFSATSSGAGGGASIELTSRTLFASKYILGKNSPYYHQVQVHLDSIVSGLYVLEPKPHGGAMGKRKRMTRFES